MYRILAFLLLLAACQSSSSPTVHADQAVRKGPHFQFSTSAPERELHEAVNWCAHNFHEAIRLDPAPGNANRRIFALGNGVHRIVVESGGQSAAFMLRKSSAQMVEVFTSANYPICLSDRVKFTLEPNGVLSYDNARQIKFTVELAEQPNGMVVALEMAPGAGYGFLVHRCDDCN